MEEKKRNGDSSNKSENKEKEIVIDKKVDALNTIEIDTIKEDENKLKDEEQKPAHTNEQKINVNPVKNKDAKKKRKIKLNKQMIGIIVIVISCIVITISLVILKIRDINSKYKIPEEENVFISENKKQDDELKYVVGENDTLDYNNIDYTDAYIIDGKEIPKDEYSHLEYGNYSTHSYNYIKISGLKDKNIENKINDKIKDYITNIDVKNRDGKVSVTSHVMGNYNNILSINMGYNNSDGSYIYEGINFDLNTGNTIQLEDVFTKSASIINILYTGLCEELAWDIDINYDDYIGNDEEYFKKYRELANMDNRDTSYYEDIIFKLSNWYKNNKGNIKFAVSSSELFVYNVLIDGNNYNLKIPLSHFKNCVAIYKRFSSNDNIYDNNKYGSGYIPFTKPMSHYSNCLLLNKVDYGKKSSNLFIDVCLNTYTNVSYEHLNNNIDNSLKVLSNNLIVEESKKASNNLQNGYILQAEIGVSDYTDEHGTSYYNYEVDGYLIPHYRIIFHIYESELPIDDYKKNFIYYLEEAAIYPTASSIPPPALYYLQSIGKTPSNFWGETKIYYFDINGNYLGDDIHVIKDTTREVYNPS